MYLEPGYSITDSQATENTFFQQESGDNAEEVEMNVEEEEAKEEEDEEEEDKEVGQATIILTPFMDLFHLH